MSKFAGLYDIRDAVESDKSFILATFLRGLYYGSSGDSHLAIRYDLIDKNIFMNNYDHIASALINASVVKVACLKEDPDVIMGYSILSQDYQTIHFVYCKRNWRNKGIGRSLVPAHPTYVSHLTDLGNRLLNKINNPIYNPFSI